MAGATAAAPVGLLAPADLPLAGMRVVELGSGIAAGFCGKLLAAFGADVLKVEPPGGDALRARGPFAGDVPDPEGSLLFLYLHTGKRSVTLGPSSATGRALLQRLLVDADVVLDGLGAGGLERLGLPYPALAALSPTTVLTSLTPFGEDGPYSGYAASELVLLALSGLLHMVGDPEREPLKLGGAQAQYTAGLSAFTGTLAALYARDATGLGQRVEVAGQACVAFVEWKGGTYYQASGRVRRRGGADSQWLVLPCRDGFVAFVYQDEHWPAVVELIGDARLREERFARRDGRLKERETLRAILGGWTAPRTKAEVYTLAQARGIPVGLVADMAELAASPQYAARAFLQPVDHPTTGPVLYPGVACTIDGQRVPLQRAPLLGEHNRQEYTDRLRLDAMQLVALRERGVI